MRGVSTRERIRGRSSSAGLGVSTLERYGVGFPFQSHSSAAGNV
jgi:hypothetical protein